MHNGERELSNTALILTRHLDREFEDLLSDQRDISTLLGAGALNFQLGAKSVHEILRSKASGIGEFELFDAVGMQVNSSRAWVGATLSQQQFPPAEQLKPIAGRKSSIGLIRDAVTTNWIIVLSRPITDQDGTLIGTIVRRIPASLYETFFSSVALGEQAALALFLDDSALVARYPEAHDSIGKVFRFGSLEQLFRDGSMTFQSPSPFDGSLRLAVSRPLKHVPLLLVASRSIPAILTDWRKQTELLLSIAAALAIVISLVLSMFARRLLQQHKETQYRLKMDKKRLDVAVNNMSHGLTMFDAAGRLEVFNQPYLDIYGLSSEVVKPGITFEEIVAHFREIGGEEEPLQQYFEFVASHKDQKGTVEVSFSDGKSVLITRQIISEGGLVTTHEDITHRKKAQERIAHLAHFDELTGLPNRTSFRDHLNAAFASLKDSNPLALLYIDVDEFKTVNDTLGHPIGDQLLKAIADRLESCLRHDDYIARLGGDEFAIVLHDQHSAHQIGNFAKMVHAAVRDTYDCDGHAISSDVSIGIAIAPQHGSDPNQLISHADMALYAAKSDGRRTFRFFEPEMDITARAKHELAVELRRAVADRAFDIHFQPLVDLATGQISGCEALLRWHHPTRGAISPAEFIPLAEEIGLIEELGEWVLAESCREAATWPSHMTVAVNVSPIQFKRQTFALNVALAVARAGLGAHRLELEITEALLLRDNDTTLATLTELRNIGIKIALDDFGTGYSSLSYLHRFPIDKIKIDKSFVARLTDEQSSLTIIQAIVQIAASGDRITLAEGVETSEQRDLLKKIGCTQMQGYLFSPALRTEDLNRLISSGQVPDNAPPPSAEHSTDELRAAAAT
ncbi:bifunctional diguanylate cyclase/phosphodiesterase [Rhodopseudomonas faecalis]|uniref:bifunctional diguanylate cyclase/phosphodiesterase n=1 Tax=Rhodopseudomonas faecalis TaxID=99655 RepID=UPI001FDEF691|nr:EAL domain-containing protein [Rhodopseudomonas faecalis]